MAKRPSQNTSTLSSLSGRKWDATERWGISLSLSPSLSLSLSSQCQWTTGNIHILSDSFLLLICVSLWWAQICINMRGRYYFSQLYRRANWGRESKRPAPGDTAVGWRHNRYVRKVGLRPGVQVLPLAPCSSPAFSTGTPELGWPSLVCRGTVWWHLNEEVREKCLRRSPWARWRSREEGGSFET